MVDLSEKEAVALYRFIKAREEELNVDLVPVFTRIERHLYETMSIEEVEALSHVKFEDKAR
jgi:hypothetical protein